MLSNKWRPSSILFENFLFFISLIGLILYVIKNYFLNSGIINPVINLSTKGFNIEYLGDMFDVSHQFLCAYILGVATADFIKITVEDLEIKYSPTEIARLLLGKYDCLKQSVSLLLLQMFSFLAAFTIVGMYNVMGGSMKAVSGLTISMIPIFYICYTLDCCYAKYQNLIVDLRYYYKILQRFFFSRS